MSVGDARAGWDIDLRDGQQREEAFRALLGDEIFRCEHKRDYRGERTGAHAIEFERSSRPRGEGSITPTGIAVTRAEWWIVEFLEDHRILLPVATAKALKDEALSLKMHRWGGDNNRTHFALVPRAWLVDVQRIWHLRPELRPAPDALQLGIAVHGTEHGAPTDEPPAPQPADADDRAGG